MKKTRKLGRDEFHLKKWLKSNIDAFAKECPDNANFEESHAWWKQRALSTLEPELASDVSRLLAGGMAAGGVTDNPQVSVTFIHLGSELLAIKQ